MLEYTFYFNRILFKISATNFHLFGYYDSYYNNNNIKFTQRKLFSEKYIYSSFIVT